MGRSLVGSLPEDDERALVRFEEHRNLHGAGQCPVLGQVTDILSQRIPELRSLAGNPEYAVEGDRLVTLVRDKVVLAVGKSEVDELERKLGIVRNEVRNDAEIAEDLLEGCVLVDPAFAVSD